jgi:hypothetical protein
MLHLIIIALVVISLLLFAVLYIVLKDAAPIVENPPRSPEERAYFSAFSNSYFEARKKFRDAAKNANAKLSSHLVCIDDVTGLDLTIDVAVVNAPPDNNNNNKTRKIDLIVHCSATHGVEGYVGSAIQIRALENIAGVGGAANDQKNNYDSSKPTIVFVHSVNPFGMANFRRFNENNVDLNRNCITSTQLWNEVMSRTPNQFGYESFKHVLVPHLQKLITYASRFTIFIPGILKLIQVGLPTLKKVFVTGQYHMPSGTYYGGQGKLERSWVVVRDAVKPYVLQARRLISIDVHSGLGPVGVDSMMVENKEQHLIATQIFPTRDRTTAPLFSYPNQPGQEGASAGYEHMRGSTTIGGLSYPEESEKEVDKHFDFRLELTQEFGTQPNLLVARAVILENAAFQQARGSPIHRMSQELSRAAFYVETLAWKDSILRRGLERLDQAVEYLKNH